MLNQTKITQTCGTGRRGAVAIFGVLMVLAGLLLTVGKRYTLPLDFGWVTGEGKVGLLAEFGLNGAARYPHKGAARQLGEGLVASVGKVTIGLGSSFFRRRD